MIAHAEKEVKKDLVVEYRATERGLILCKTRGKPKESNIKRSYKSNTINKKVSSTIKPQMARTWENLNMQTWMKQIELGKQRKHTDLSFYCLMPI